MDHPSNAQRKSRTDRARKNLREIGLTLQKSRIRYEATYDKGGYRISKDGIVLAGELWELTIDDVETLYAKCRTDLTLGFLADERQL